MARSKKYVEASKKVDNDVFYTITDGIKLAQETSYSKFTGKLELTLNFNVPEKLKKEPFRGSVVFPNQAATTTVKVAVIATGPDEANAINAGADEVGGEELIKKIEEGFLDFDVLISTPTMMAKMAKLGRVLGPKGLMPNPRNETVTTDVERVVKSYKSGKLDFKLDEQGGIRAKVGQLDLTEEQLKENLVVFAKAAYNETKKLGPSRLKSAYLSATMGPGIKIDKADFLKEVE